MRPASQDRSFCTQPCTVRWSIGTPSSESSSSVAWRYGNRAASAMAASTTQRLARCRGCSPRAVSSGYAYRPLSRSRTCQRSSRIQPKRVSRWRARRWSERRLGPARVRTLGFQFLAQRHQEPLASAAQRVGEDLFDLVERRRVRHLDANRGIHLHCRTSADNPRSAACPQTRRVHSVTPGGSPINLSQARRVAIVGRPVAR